MDENDKGIIDLFDNAKPNKLDDLFGGNSEEEGDIESDELFDEDENDSVLVDSDDDHEYYLEEDEEGLDEELLETDVEIGNFINVGDVITFGDDEEEDFSIDMECVFKVWYEGNMYVLFHPKEAPEQTQFVPMRIELDEEEDEDGNEQTEQFFVPVTVEEIAEQIVAMYKSEQK